MADLLGTRNRNVGGPPRLSSKRSVPGTSSNLLEPLLFSRRDVSTARYVSRVTLHRPSSCASCNPSAARPSRLAPPLCKLRVRAAQICASLPSALPCPAPTRRRSLIMGRPRASARARVVSQAREGGRGCDAVTHLIEEFGCQRSRGLLRRAQRARNDAVLNKNLDGLRHPCGPLAALLDGAEIVRSHGMGA